MKFNYADRRVQEEAAAPEAGAGGGASLLDPVATPEPAATPAEPTPQFVEDGWMKGVDLELSQNASLQSFTDVNGLIKSYVNAQKLIGKDKIPVPDEHASDEDWQGIYDKLGRPIRDKYNVDFGESTYGDDFKKGFLDAAHKDGIMPHQAQKMFNYWNDQINTANETHTSSVTEEQNEAIGNLRKEWGAGFDKNLEIGRVALKKFADDDTINYLRETGLGDNPVLIKLFNAVGSSLNEDTFNRATVDHLGMSKEDATGKYNTVMGNSEHPYWHKSHPSHSAAVKEMSRFSEIMYS